MPGFSVYGGGGFAAPGTAPSPAALPEPWQSLGRMNNPGMAAYAGPAAPPRPIGPTGQSPWMGGALPQPQQGGTTRRGSQILDAQGNVIGHYDDNNQPVYHGGQGGGGYQNLGPINQGPIQDWLKQHQGHFPSPQGPVASTNMGMAPSWARLGAFGGDGNQADFLRGERIPASALGVPGSMQQSLYGQGLLRPAMPSMNNQSGY